MTQDTDDTLEEKSDVPRTAAYLVAWFISVGLTLLDIALLRSAYLALVAWWADRRITTTAQRIDFDFLISFLDRALLILIVIGGLVAVIALEHTFRRLAGQRALLKKGWRPMAILVGIGLLALLVQWVL
jgi:hypothetical protein